MSGAIKVVLGLILILVGLWVYLSKWFHGFFGNQFMAMLYLILGNLPGLVILIGLIVLLLGLSDIKG